MFKVRKLGYNNNKARKNPAWFIKGGRQGFCAGANFASEKVSIIEEGEKKYVKNE